MVWRVAGNRSLAAVTASPSYGIVMLSTPLAANLTSVVLNAYGTCLPGSCACNFTAPGTCPPPALAAGASATCSFTCRPGTVNTTIVAAFNSYSVATGITVASYVANASSVCATLSTPLLTSRAYPPGSWPSPVSMCSSFSQNVTTTKPPYGAGQCTAFDVTNYTTSSSAELVVGGSTIAVNASALVPCESPQVAITWLNYTRTQHWQW